MGDTKGRNEKSKSRINPVLFWSAIAFLVAAIWLWEEVIEDRVIAKRFGVVENKLIYRSGQISDSLIKKVLEKHSIKVIVDLTSVDQADKRQAAERQAARELGVEYSRFPMAGDGTGSIENYAAAVAAIVQARKQNKPVLVHCAAGSMRTGGVIATYRLLVEKRDSNYILDEMMQYDWDPGNHKHSKLIDFLNDNMPDIEALLKQAGVLEKTENPVPRIQLSSMDCPRDFSCSVAAAV